MSERRPDRGCVVLPGRRLLAVGAGLCLRGGGRRRRRLPAHGLMLMMTCSLIVGTIETVVGRFQPLVKFTTETRVETAMTLRECQLLRDKMNCTVGFEKCTILRAPMIYKHCRLVLCSQG